MRWSTRLMILIAGFVGGLMAVMIGIGSQTGWAEPPKPLASADLPIEVWSIIQDKCHACHQPKKRQGGLDMSSLASMLEGGDSGPALIPGNADRSLLIELVEFDEMPPRKQPKRQSVTPKELKTLRSWVEMAKAP
jgi:uncharacterized membrane protein